MLTRKQIKFLKYLKANESLTYDDIKRSYTEKDILRTFDILLRDNYITDDSLPIKVFDSMGSQPKRYCLSDKGNTALELMNDQRHNFITQLFIEKSTDMIVSAIVSFITALITTLVTSYFLH